MAQPNPPLRNPPVGAPLPAPLGAGAPTAGRSASDESDKVARNAWSARLLISFAACLVLIVEAPEHYGGPVYALLGAIIVIYALPIVAASRRMRSPAQRRSANIAALIFETFLLTVVLSVLGGLTGPLVGLYGILVLLGGLAAGQRWAIAIGASAFAFYGVAVVLLNLGALPEFALEAHRLTSGLTETIRALFLAAAVVGASFFATSAYTEAIRSRADQAESRYRALFQAATEPIVVWDPKTTEIIDVNPAGVEVSGLTREELVGGIGLQFLPYEDREQIQQAIGSGHLASRDGETVVRYRRPDGEERILSVLAGEFAHDGGPGIVAIVKDLTDAIRRSEDQRQFSESLQKEVEARTADLHLVNEKLRDMHSKLLKAQKLSAAEDLAGAVAHSINNPLAALLGTVELAIESSPSKSASLERILYLARRIKRVVDSTLELFRRGALQLQRAEPQEILHALRDELSERARRAAVEVELKIEPNLPAVVIDRTLLLAALVSIAENALDAVQDRAGGQIWLECEQVGSLHAVCFRIIDNGPGIPAALREKVFDPFFTTRGGGTGLGLAIANGIVQGHQGSIKISDRPLGGTVVSVELATEGAGEEPS